MIDYAVTAPSENRTLIQTLCVATCEETVAFVAGLKYFCFQRATRLTMFHFALWQKTKEILL